MKIDEIMREARGEVPAQVAALKQRRQAIQQRQQAATQATPPAQPAQPQQPAAPGTIPVGTEVWGPDGLWYQFQGQQWVQKPGQRGGQGRIASKDIAAKLASKFKFRQGVKTVAQKAVTAYDTVTKSAVGQALGGAAKGIAAGLASAGKNAGDPMGLGGYQPARESLRTDNPCWKGYHPVGTKKKDGRTVPNCVPESLEETYEGDSFYEAYGEVEETLEEAEYQGRKVPLGKPMRGDVKKFKVYVKDPKTGNVKKVNFGDPDMKIRKSNPKARKSFRARHNCANPGPRTKARYWSCRKW
jgi:hypothetical protein